jgi:uncharacterized protein
MTDSLIEVRKIKDVKLHGGILLDGFPSVGLANAIASECLIHSMKTEFVAILDSPAFPPLSVIRGSQPSFPARIYANEEIKLGMFVSELNLDPALYRPVAELMLQWAHTNGCDLIISGAGIPYESSEQGETEVEVYATGSTARAVKKFEDAGIKRLGSGSVVGIPAILLNEGTWRKLDVIVLLVKVLKDAPDFRAGAAIAEAITKLVPGATCDIGALLHEADVTEKTLRQLRSEQPPAGGAGQPEMYG